MDPPKSKDLDRIMEEILMEFQELALEGLLVEMPDGITVIAIWGYAIHHLHAHHCICCHSGWGARGATRTMGCKIVGCATADYMAGAEGYLETQLGMRRSGGGCGGGRRP